MVLHQSASPVATASSENVNKASPANGFLALNPQTKRSGKSGQSPGDAMNLTQV